MTINYGNSKIYAIRPTVPHNEGEIYIGSTTRKYLSQRMAQHKTAFRRHVSGKDKKRATSFDIFGKYGLDSVEMVLLETVNAQEKRELLLREKHYIQSGPCVNKHIPLLDKNEYNRRYYSNNEKYREYQREYQKKYRLRNKAFEYYWEDGTPCTEQEYYDSLN